MSTFNFTQPICCCCYFDFIWMTSAHHKLMSRPRDVENVLGTLSFPFRFHLHLAFCSPRLLLPPPQRRPQLSTLSRRHLSTSCGGTKWLTRSCHMTLAVWHFLQLLWVKFGLDINEEGVDIVNESLALSLHSVWFVFCWTCLTELNYFFRFRTSPPPLSAKVLIGSP